MATGENRLFTSHIIDKNGRPGLDQVFRTRKACTEWRDAKREAGTKTSPPKPAAWGPNQ